MPYLVIAHLDENTDEERGLYDSLDEARGCVEFDRLQCYSIYCGEELVESSEAGDFENRGYQAGYAYASGYQD